MTRARVRLGAEGPTPVAHLRQFRGSFLTHESARASGDKPPNPCHRRGNFSLAREPCPSVVPA